MISTMAWALGRCSTGGYPRFHRIPFESNPRITWRPTKLLVTARNGLSDEHLNALEVQLSMSCFLTSDVRFCLRKFHGTSEWDILHEIGRTIQNRQFGTLLFYHQQAAFWTWQNQLTPRFRLVNSRFDGRTPGRFDDSTPDFCASFRIPSVSNPPVIFLIRCWKRCGALNKVRSQLHMRHAMKAITAIFIHEYVYIYIYICIYIYIYIYMGASSTYYI